MKTQKFKVVKTLVTPLEAEILREIENSDHATDGYGLQGHIMHDEYDMKKYRGVLASLVKKGIIECEEYSSNEMFGSHNAIYSTWCSVNSKYQIEDNTNTETGYEFKDIDFSLEEGIFSQA